MLPLALNLLLRQSAAIAAYARSLHVSGVLLVAAAALVPFVQLGGLLGGLPRSAREHTAAQAAATIARLGTGGVLGIEATPGQETLAHRTATTACLTGPVETEAPLPAPSSPRPARPFVRQGLERGPPVLP